ncbi:radical SAM protein [Pseudothermotoga sp.]|nr:radical SAM protein [Pseudothermotoga sp.]MCX7813767.1 radical SAM protein [Pseudothermotoga sp.]MDW8140585.1 radical SAM protein [Pseudothermotoga sp.]
MKLSISELKLRADKLYELLESCTLCPRNCRVNRFTSKDGACRTGVKPIVSSFGPHFGEESFLVGVGGSGTIFFTNCNLSCVFCQNWTISQMHEGEEIEVKDLASIMLKLQRMNCHNINLVSPTHQVPMIVEAIIYALESGLRIPIVYNCGGYESIQTLKLLEGVIDIYMPDFKYGDDEKALKYSKVTNYTTIAKSSLEEMFRQVGPLKIEHGIATRGVFVRHLVMPNDASSSERVLELIASVSVEIPVNIMAQYYPAFKAHNHPEISRRITHDELTRALKKARELGLKIVS